MRRIYNFKQIVSSLLLKSRKAVKGSVSLLLAFVVTPLLGMTLLMVESIRYQDVIEEMIEINDLSAYATLANYDPFVKERFGLLAVSQDEDIQSLFNKYFNENKRLVDNDMIVKSCTIDGEYSLKDLAVMKQQIIEYSEYSAFFDAVFESGNLTELLDDLNEAINVEALQKMTTELSCASTVMDGVVQAYNAIEAASKYIEEDYDPALTAYEDAYDDFEDALNDYIKALNGYTGNGNIYEDDDVVAAWEAVTKDSDSPCTVYKKACDDLAKKIEGLEDKLDAVAEGIEDALDAYDELNDSLANEDQGYAVSTGFKFTMDVAGTLLPLIEAIADEDIEDFVSDTVSDLEDLSEALKKMEMEDFDADSSKDDTKKDWYVEIDDINSITEHISRFMKNYDDIDTEAEVETALDLIDIILTLCDIPCMIDPNCRAIIKSEKNKEPWEFESFQDLANLVAYKGNDISNACGIVGIAAFCDCIEHIKFPPNTLQCIILTVELFVCTTALATGLLVWVMNIHIDTAIGIANYKEWWNHILLCGYAAYNFPNRTNYMQSLDISGYNYGMEIYRDVCGQDMDNPGLYDFYDAYWSISGANMIAHAITDGSILPQTTGKTFYGAEQEYLLCGWTNEVYNQCGAFYNILMLRLVLDLVPLFKDEGVRKIAQKAGPYAWLVYIGVWIGEAFLDTFILANGGDMSLVKGGCYLSPDGIGDLASSLAGLSDRTEKYSAMISWSYTIYKKDWKGINPFSSGILPHTSYTDHMFILFLTRTHDQALLNRMQNILINESEAYYEYHTGMEFKISKTYTYVHTDIAYDINPMFDFSSLTDSGVFTKTVHQERYIGY
ncbi:YlbF family regulator [Butyrivibrio sp. AE2032]|uniref:YlbF family regulator n=1 Tax=Butyrivibrio sp. AE2032 TaxID=1458463 RepID=UPI00054F8317|nr:YlbF family regulator [Butyrivibrio sp. AE2032]